MYLEVEGLTQGQFLKTGLSDIEVCNRFLSTFGIVFPVCI